MLHQMKHNCNEKVLVFLGKTDITWSPERVEKKEKLTSTECVPPIDIQLYLSGF